MDSDDRRPPAALTAVVFGVTTLSAALVAWLVTGAKGEAVVMRAIASTAFAGVAVGRFAPRWLKDAEPRTAARTGLIVGLLVHPITWLMYSLAGWLAPTSLGAQGSLFAVIENAFLWTAASIPYGAALTIPTSLAGAFLIRQVFWRRR